VAGRVVSTLVVGSVTSTVVVGRVVVLCVDVG
jgi:hypothetical protein